MGTGGSEAKRGGFGFDGAGGTGGSFGALVKGRQKGKYSHDHLVLDDEGLMSRLVTRHSGLKPGYPLPPPGSLLPAHLALRTLYARPLVRADLPLPPKHHVQPHLVRLVHCVKGCPNGSSGRNLAKTCSPR